MMPHKNWCGKPCSECKRPCALDESVPCSPSCELLGENGEPINLQKCWDNGCDAIENKERGFNES
jgi:hypothetical protein